MKQNKYDDDRFFQKYSGMKRSVEGLQGAGEWHELQALLPDFAGKRVLDLGCGFGWHCRYAAQHGAAAVLGIDLSEKMLAKARATTAEPQVEYRQLAIEDARFAEESYDVVLSSLALHYVPDVQVIYRRVYRWLAPGGHFVFSAEHPVFTAYGSQDWYYDAAGHKLHWPVDRYFLEGERRATFLGEAVTKYHRTATGYLNGLLQAGFALRAVAEPQPSEQMLQSEPAMADELRRPMMLLAAAQKAL